MGPPRARPARPRRLPRGGRGERASIVADRRVGAREGCAQVVRGSSRTPVPRPDGRRERVGTATRSLAASRRRSSDVLLRETAASRPADVRAGITESVLLNDVESSRTTLGDLLARSVSAWRSMTSARDTHRSSYLSRFPSTRSRSIAASWPAWARTPMTPRSSRPSCGWPRRSSWTSSRKVSRRASSSRASVISGVRGRRGTCSPGRCRPSGSRPGWRTRRSRRSHRLPRPSGSPRRRRPNLPSRRRPVPAHRWRGRTAGSSGTHHPWRPHAQPQHPPSLLCPSPPSPSSRSRPPLTQPTPPRRSTARSREAT